MKFFKTYLFTALIIAIISIISVMGCKKSELFLSPQVSTSEVEQFATSYFESKYSILTDRTAEATKIYLHYTNEAAWAQEEVALFKESRKQATENEYAVMSVEVHIKVDSVQRLNEHTIKVIIATDISQHTNAVDLYSGEKVTTEELNNFVLAIQELGNGEFRVMSETEIWPTDYPSQSLEDTDSESRDVVPKAQAPKIKTYSHSKAAKYAIKNSTLRISCTEYFSARGGDCTNFISNCLEAGGWVQDNDWYKGKNCIFSSHSWGGADPFRRFAQSEKSNRVESVKSSTSKLVVGDIISFEQNGNDSYDHTAMVTKISKKEIFISYHTKDTRDKSLSDFISASKKKNKITPTIKAIKISETYR